MVVFQVAAGVLLGKVLYDLLDEALSKALPKKPTAEKKVAKGKPMVKKPTAKRKAKRE